MRFLYNLERAKASQLKDIREYSSIEYTSDVSHTI